MRFKGVTILVNYPDDEAEAAVPSKMGIHELVAWLHKLCDEEPEMTSFVLTAAVDKTETP